MRNRATKMLLLYEEVGVIRDLRLGQGFRELQVGSEVVANTSAIHTVELVKIN